MSWMYSRESFRPANGGGRVYSSIFPKTQQLLSLLLGVSLVFQIRYAAVLPFHFYIYLLFIYRFFTYIFAKVCLSHVGRPNASKYHTSRKFNVARHNYVVFLMILQKR